MRTVWTRRPATHPARIVASARVKCLSADYSFMNDLENGKEEISAALMQLFLNARLRENVDCPYIATKKAGI